MDTTSPRTNPSLTLDPDGIGHLVFDDPVRRHNVLDESVMTGLRACIAEARTLAAASRLRALVVESGKPDSFMAGADIDAIASLAGAEDGEEKARLGQEVYTALAALPVPTIAAIHGLCLGGGLELALACRHRVCSDDAATRLGLPEVQLGVLPGWGGTTRLPRLVGLQASLDLLLTGNPAKPSKAARIGLVDQVLPAAGFGALATGFARDVADGRTRPRRAKRSLLVRLGDETAPGRALVLRIARRQVMAKTGGHYPAPLRILDVLARALGRSVEHALGIEARAFGELSATPEHRNLLHLFGLREAARKTAALFPGIEPAPVRRLGVLGAGIMGGGIAQLAAFRDVDVRMKDIRDDAVIGGLKHAKSLFDKGVKRRAMTRREAERRMNLIAGGLDWHGFATADVVVEAVVERLDVKRAVLAECEAQVREGCVLATNTSSLSVDEMAEALARPADFAGLHFFNPVHRMPLVEVVRGAQTSDRTAATLHAFAVTLGKVPVVCRDGAGFVVNRILGPYMNEAGHLLADGAGIETIDRVALDFGLPMGPLRLMDEVGLDIARHAGATLHEAFGERMAPSAPLVALASGDRLGRKNGRGFYRYRDGRDAGVDRSILAELGVRTGGGAPSIDVIRDRLILAMVNEAARVLDNAIVGSAGELDLAMIMGTGFPPFRGGLLRHADSLGASQIVAKLQALATSAGPRFAPAPLLERLAREGRSFYDAFPGGGARGGA